MSENQVFLSGTKQTQIVLCNVDGISCAEVQRLERLPSPLILVEVLITIRTI